MKIASFYMPIVACLLLLVTAGAWAQGGTTVVQPVSSYTGLVADEGKIKDAVSPITDQAALSALWGDWGVLAPMPTVDFTKQLVVVSTSLGGGFHQMLTLDNTGNLTIKERPYPVADTLPGFRYVIAVIIRAGITSVNGVPLPVPVTILRSASASMSAYNLRQFLTITDEKTWEGVWVGRVQVAVDFTKEEALFVAMGERHSSGYSVAITGVTETAQRITATVEETSPIKSDIPVLTVTQPCTVAIIPKSNKPVYFADSALGGTVVPILNTITAADSLQKTADTAVIKDVAAWKELYNKRMPAGTALPDVDFGKDMAIVVFAGATQNVGPTISQVVEVEGALRVGYFLPTVTAAGTPAPPAYPWTAVIVPRSDLPVMFINDAPAFNAGMGP